MTTSKSPAEIKRARRIGMLRRRADHLQRRIVENPTRNLSYDQAELSALRWAVSELDPQPESKGGAT